MKRELKFLLLVSIVVFLNDACSNKKNQIPSQVQEAEIWITKADKTILLQKQASPLDFNSPTNNNPFIEIDTNSTYQFIDGFGYTLTGGSAYLINRMDGASKSALLNELFSSNDNSIKVSYLRISIGASDLDASVFSYDDMPAGETDTTLARFNFSRDSIDLIPVLKQIIAINPALKIMGSPWSPPVWMKDNTNSTGGSLLPKYYGVYAQYFVKYIQKMKEKGITIDAITIQNEPQHGGNNPSMVMSAAQQAEFIKNHLGPAFKTEGIQTKIIIWDHNCDHPEYPITVLNDAEAKQYINGSAFHLYNGDVSALSVVHQAHPDKHLYFTEQWTGANSSFDDDLKWHIKNVIIGSMRNWSKVALEWNLANDPNYNPHTPGGCTECKGAFTISGSSVTKNVSYYIIGHASKFIPPGSERIHSTEPGNLYNAAFKTANGKKVLVVLNDKTTSVSFNIRVNDKWAATELPPASVATYVW